MPIKVKRGVPVEGDNFGVFTRDHWVFNGTQRYFLRHSLHRLSVQRGVFLPHHFESSLCRFADQVVQKHHCTIPGRHGDIPWQIDNLICKVLHPVSPWVTHQFQYLAHLLHVERLAHIDHINGLIEVIFREFHDRQRDFLGGIQRGAVGAQNDHHPVFLFGAQFFVEVDDDRVFGAAIFSQPAFDQLVDHRLSRLFHFAFKVDPVEMLTQEFVNLLKTFH